MVVRGWGRGLEETGNGDRGLLFGVLNDISQSQKVKYCLIPLI